MLLVITNITLPALTTALVCSEVPDAMLVRVKAASNCKAESYSCFKHSTSTGIIPVGILSSNNTIIYEVV